jgi:N-acetyl-gamma-glutamylphosphate reductase
MAPSRVFITGATGYIGGSVLKSIVKNYPDLEINVLLRSLPEEFRSRYPKVNVLQGTFGDFNLIEKAVQNADITIRKSSCYVPYCKFSLGIIGIFSSSESHMANRYGGH